MAHGQVAPHTPSSYASDGSTRLTNTAATVRQSLPAATTTTTIPK